jgi:hypothetical protein
MMGHYTIPAWVSLATLLSYLAITPFVAGRQGEFSFHFNSK